MGANLPGAVSEKTRRLTRSPKLDAELADRYAKNPAAFRRRSFLNLIVGVFFLVFTVIIGVLAIHVFGLSSGGDAVVLMAIFSLLIALAIFHDVRWRYALDRSGGKLPQP